MVLINTQITPEHDIVTTIFRQPIDILPLALNSAIYLDYTIIWIVYAITTYSIA